MRKDGALYYLIGDHLGSTSLVTDAAGTVVSQTRYKAWGDVRHQSGVTPTAYQFTSQYSYAAEFGLLFYNARWYDPALGRFAQADSIVPPGGQGTDRYSYTNNNPVRYTDPSGHICVESDGDSDVGMAGNCHGKENKKYNGGLLGPEWNENKGKIIEDDESNPPTSIKDKLVEGLYNASNFAQDIAFLIDIPFAITEAIFIVGECIMAFPAGCKTGALMGQAAFNISGANAAESFLGFVSFALTASADLLDDGNLGEPTATSFATLTAGSMMIDPIGDLLIDRYASGYNHGIYNGIISLMNGEPLLRSK